MFLHTLSAEYLFNGTTGILGAFGLLSLVALVALCFPAVRRVQALFAPCIVIVTIAATVVLVGLMMVVYHKMQQG